jgi:hypothetical protein
MILDLIQMNFYTNPDGPGVVEVAEIFSDYCGLGTGSDKKCILSEILKITFFPSVFYLCSNEKLIGEK